MELNNQATLGGARAVGLGNVVGSLTPGKRADVVLLRTDTVQTAPVHDPVIAVLSQGGAAAVETVLVDGRMLKREGRLVHTDAGRAVRDLRLRAAELEARVGRQGAAPAPSGAAPPPAAPAPLSG